MAAPSRGDVWWVNLSPSRGHEQAGERPALVVSVDRFNKGPAGLIVVAPMTTTERNIPLHIPVLRPEANMDRTSYIQCDQPRCISRQRLSRKIGTVSDETMEKVDDRLRILLGL